ncbi:MAG: hypothetical protein J6I50_09155 [Clostridia bacterium]|nr:hypothetical protein [Clostridia bacterium]
METKRKNRTRETEDEIVKLFLLHMDAYSWSKGHRRLKAALLYILELENPEDHQVKELYCEVAVRTKCSCLAAEHSLRYEIQKLWNTHPEECSRLFYRSATRCSCPSVSGFLILFYTANKRNSIQNWIESAETRSLSIYTFQRVKHFIQKHIKTRRHLSIKTDTAGFIFLDYIILQCMRIEENVDFLPPYIPLFSGCFLPTF